MGSFFLRKRARSFFRNSIWWVVVLSGLLLFVAAVSFSHASFRCDRVRRGLRVWRIPGEMLKEGEQFAVGKTRQKNRNKITKNISCVFPWHTIGQLQGHLDPTPGRRSRIRFYTRNFIIIRTPFIFFFFAVRPSDTVRPFCIHIFFFIRRCYYYNISPWRVVNF